MSNRRNDDIDICYDCRKCGNHDAADKARSKVHMAVDLIKAGASAGLDIDLEGYLSGTIKLLLDEAQKEINFFEHG